MADRWCGDGSDPPVPAPSPLADGHGAPDDLRRTVPGEAADRWPGNRPANHTSPPPGGAKRKKDREFQQMMRKKNRFLPVLAALVAVPMALTACSGGGSSEPEQPGQTDGGG